MLGVRAPDRRSPDRFTLAVLNHILGGGLSSRLFQEIREARGLAYSIGSDRSAYDDAGLLAISVGTAPEHAHEVLGLLHTELDRLAAKGITPRELEVAKGHLRADLLLSLEDSGARMSRIGAGLSAVRDGAQRRGAARPRRGRLRGRGQGGRRAGADRSEDAGGRRALRGVGLRVAQGSMTRASRCSVPQAAWARPCARPCSPPPISSWSRPSIPPRRAGLSTRSPPCQESGLVLAPSAESLLEAGAEVAVDFTVASAARENLRWCADHGVHAVCGTTGFDAGDLEQMREWFSKDANGVVVANFSIGAALDDALRRAVRSVRPRCRGDRAPPRAQARRPLGHLPRDRPPDPGGP